MSKLQSISLVILIFFPLVLISRAEENTQTKAEAEEEKISMSRFQVRTMSSSFRTFALTLCLCRCCCRCRCLRLSLLLFLCRRSPPSIFLEINVVHIFFVSSSSTTFFLFLPWSFFSRLVGQLGAAIFAALGGKACALGAPHLRGDQRPDSCLAQP